jgi:Flp pilus assembly protein TadG
MGNWLIQKTRAFRKDESGTLLAEGVIMVPLLFWSLMAMYVFWDGFRTINVVQKAAYTVSDAVSRRRADVSSDYIQGMGTLFNYLLDRQQTGRVRVTSYTWTQTSGLYTVQWSCSTHAGLVKHNNASLQARAAALPIMANGDSAILVEAEVDYIAGFDMGLGTQTVKQFIVTRPRLMANIGFTGPAC